MSELEIDKKSLKELVEGAHREITALCRGEHRWRMSIPVQSSDSDIILTTALQAQTDEIARLRALASDILLFIEEHGSRELRAHATTLLDFRARSAEE